MSSHTPLDPSFHYAEDYPLAPLEDDCKLLGSLLDECLRIEVGEQLFAKIERIRTVAQCASSLARAGDDDAAHALAQKMTDELTAMPVEEAMPLTRACGHYLNLTSIAETHHAVRTHRIDGVPTKTPDEMIGELIAGGADPDTVYRAVVDQRVEIVLTAHPTQVNRRTLQYKHTRIAALLQANDALAAADAPAAERGEVIADLVREVTALWQTDELRRRRPTPVDEAAGGLHIVEQSLWAAVPAHLRRLSAALRKHTGRELPIDAAPLAFGSWMGGDRDGNPNVTAAVTRDVAKLARWMGADLYLREVDVLRFELSMNQASDEVWRMARAIVQAANDGAAPADAPTAPPRAVAAQRPTDTAGAALAAAAAAAGGAGGVGGLAMPPAPAHGPMVADGGGGGGGGGGASAGIAIPRPSVILHEAGSPSSSLVWSPPASGAGTPRGGGSSASLASGGGGGGGGRGASPARGSLAHSESDLWASTCNLAALGGGSRASRAARASGPAAPATRAPAGASPRDVPAVAAPSPRVDLSPDARKRRGLQAAARHKTSIDALLHPPARGAGAAPYRIVLGEVRSRLAATRRRMEELLAGVDTSDTAAAAGAARPYDSADEMLAPLTAIYWSLWECGSGIIAEGRLLDLIRRVACFGLGLMRVDLRQDAARHTSALDAVTTAIGAPSYAAMNEEERVAFLAGELGGRRPLIPPGATLPPDDAEVVATFRVAASLGPSSLGAYVISMATQPSDVLAVQLLMRESALSADPPLPPAALRVVPLFETLADLDGAGDSLRALLAVPWYREHLKTHHGNHQEVMLGYSDSGKDAGRLAAAWALYKCQEALVAACAEAGVSLTLFHGRGGTVGRGGGPMYLAIQSQPPGSVMGSLRITEQGEMVQNKFGIPAVATRQLDVYTTAVLGATLTPPRPPRDPRWRDIMDALAARSCAEYRSVVYGNPAFAAYFAAATPQAELASLNIGSRPARRPPIAVGGGDADPSAPPAAPPPPPVTSLRAIPWIFAWTQTRLVLPAWLGVGAAVEALAADGHRDALRAMYAEWPFFASTIDLVEMILAKADMRIAALYDDVLVSDPEQRALGEDLRRRFYATARAVLDITGHARLCANNPTLRRLIETRNPYIDPCNIVQVELLRRLRADPDNGQLKDAVRLSIMSVSSGMRNTG